MLGTFRPAILLPKGTEAPLQKGDASPEHIESSTFAGKFKSLGGYLAPLTVIESHRAGLFPSRCLSRIIQKMGQNSAFLSKPTKIIFCVSA